MELILAIFRKTNYTTILSGRKNNVLTNIHFKTVIILVTVPKSSDKIAF